MGYWVAKDRIAQGNFKPPLFEAYQVFQKTYEQSEGIWTNEDLFIKNGRRAFELDSTFYLAALHEMYWLAAWRDPRTGKLISVLEPHYDEMTKFEQAFFNANKAFYENELPAYSQYLAEKYRIFPKDPSNRDYAFQLTIRENRREKAWEVMNEINLAHMPDEWKGWRTNRAVYTPWFGLRAGKYPVVIQMLDTYLKNDDNPSIIGAYYFLKSLALLRSNQTDSVFAMIDEVKQIKEASNWFKAEYDLIDFCNRAAKELFVAGNETDAYRLLDTALTWAQEGPERMSSRFDTLDLAETYRLLGQPEKAIELTEPYVAFYDYGENSFWWVVILYYSGLGIDYALLGEREKAEEVVHKLLENKGDHAFSYYCAARACTALDKKEQAMEYIHATRIRGGNPFAFERDYYMKNLYGYPPYEEYLKTKGY
jgi:hypothetical protein